MSVDVARLVLHVFGDADGLTTPARIAANARTELGPHAEIELVAQGAVVVALASRTPGSSELVAGLEASGVAVAACRNSLVSAGLTVDELYEGVGSVASAVAHLVERQRDGWSYVRV